LRHVPLHSNHQVEIALAGMRFHVCVGVLPHERELPQPLEVDLTVRWQSAGADVLDYRDLYAAASDTIATGPLLYLEAIAESLAARVLAMGGVSWCRVVVRKPHVMLAGPLLHAQVAVERTRD